MRTLLALLVMLPLATRAEVTCEQAFGAAVDKATKLELALEATKKAVVLEQAATRTCTDHLTKVQSDRDAAIKQATTAREWNKWLVAGGIGAFALGIVGGIVIQAKLSK